MRSLYQSRSRSKRAVSNLVAYVLLISITIALSVVVYNWLRYYVDDTPVVECPEGVDLVIKSYNCVGGVNGNISLVLKNKGLFISDGYIVRVHNRTGADFGFYVIDNIGVPISPGEEYNKTYSFSGFGFDDLTFVEVQPFKFEGDAEEKALCKSLSSRPVECSP